MSHAPQVLGLLKEDALGRIERVELIAHAACVRRVACGGRIPGSRWLARRLLSREKRALLAARGLQGIPELIPSESATFVAADARSGSRREAFLLRSWIDGEPLHRTETLPLDFFDHLDALVSALHERGVCHNDLHKEQNIVVGRDGYPWLIDFQLASVHRRRTKLFASRAREDLRHVEKHRRRYSKPGRGRADTSPSHGKGHGLRRSWLAAAWRRTVKPVYHYVTRGVLGVRDGEERRATAGPWPRWSPALGPRPGLDHSDPS